MDDEPNEVNEETHTHQFISELEKETQEMTERLKQEFCKHLLGCPGRDADCFHPYKTEGCHDYRKFEGL